MLGRLSTVTHPDGAVTTFLYDKVGNRQSVSRATSTGNVFSTTAYAYDSLNRLTDITNATGSNGLVSKYHYGLRLDGKRSSVTESGPATSGGTTGYTYDDAGKLTQEAGPYAAVVYGYDNVGNRLTRTVTGATTGGGATLTNGTTTNAYDANDRVTTVNGSATHSYDADGNETTVAGQAASYDFENHLVSLGSGATSYVYDADGNRVSVTSGGVATGFVVDTSLSYASVVEEYSGTTLANGTLAARYDYGDDLVRMDRTTPSVSMSYYLYDGLGSTRQLVSTSGTVTDTWGYSAFGELASRTGSTVNTFLFNAQQFDQPTGTYFLRARYYDQSNGRFLGQDPFGGSDEDPVSLHRYLYAGVDPVQMVDPSGEDPSLVSISITSAIISGISGAIVGGIRDGVSGAIKGLVIGAAFGAIGSVAVAGIGIGVAAVTGISATTAIFATSSVVTAASVGLSVFDYVHAKNDRERLADGVSVVFSLGFAGFSAYKFSEIPNLPPNIRSGDYAFPGSKQQVGTLLSEYAALMRGEVIVAREVTVKTATTRVRIDLVTRDLQGNLNFVESKFGPSAAFTPNQRVGYPEINATGGEVRGVNGQGIGLPSGSRIPPSTVRVDWWQ